MLGTIVNTIVIIIGSLVGILLKKGIPERISDTVMKGVALCVMYIGISGTLKGQNTLILIISMVIGCIIGELCDLDSRLRRMGDRLEARFKKEGSENVSIAEGFVSASLLFCVGAMAIVGSLQSGLEGNHETLFTKSMLDGISSVIFASTLGIGVMFSAVMVFLYQGCITLLAQFIAPYLGDAAIAEMTCVGSVLIVALSLNMLGITKIKVMNYIPAVFIPIVLCMFM